MESQLINEHCDVKVAVRIRPLLRNENKYIIQHLENDPQVLIINDKRNIFAFDQVFRDDVPQNSVYEATVKPLITKVIDGFNCTILAYGQTGTGKTYTMGSDVKLYNENAGLISRLLEEFFQYSSLNYDVQLSMSFIEIYNEKVYDLLTINESSILNVKGFRVQNMTCVNIRDSKEAYHWLDIGSKIRHTGHTALNSNSSRSHAIFTLYFISGGTTSKFHMVDLAGSESVRRTGNEGKAFREGITINKGLLTVGRVINALSNNDKVIPYRDSILTTILQDSLNIKNYVVLLACVSPSSEDINETLATLRFAEKTKTLKSRPQLESLACEFEKSHPGVFEKPILGVGPTPYKRKGNMQTLSTIKKKKPAFVTPFSINSPSFSLSTLNSNDTLSISTSTTIEQEPLSYSPLVRRCTEAVQTRMIQHLDTLVKTHLSIAQTPAKYKENIDVNIPWDKMENTITKIVQREILQVTNQKPQRLQSTNEEHTFIKSRCALNFDSDSPTEKSISENGTTLFKMPRKKTPVKPRYSTRLSLLKPKDCEEISSRLMFKPQRRSMRLSSMSLAIPNSDVETSYSCPKPAPRVLINKVDLPVPAPRRRQIDNNLQMKQMEMPFTIKKTATKGRRKSVRSQHLNYILQVLNNGTLKDLKQLPTIGQKTAIVIYTHRQLHGDFKAIKELKKITGWRGTGYDRFIKANHLEIFI